MAENFCYGGNFQQIDSAACLGLGYRGHSSAASHRYDPPSPHTANPIVLQNEPMVEFDRTPNPIRDDLLQTEFRLENGHLPVPSGPGLGVDIDENVLQRLAVSH